MDFHPTIVKTKEFKERFWSKVKKTKICWNWISYISQTGYGKLTHKRTLISAHRTSWIMKHKKSIPKGLCVCHKCDNTICVKPSHLWLGTPKENANDRHKKKRDACGENNGGGKKLTWDNVRTIRKDWIPYKFSKQALANKYGVSLEMVKNIVYKTHWKE